MYLKDKKDQNTSARRNATPKVTTRACLFILKSINTSYTSDNQHQVQYVHTPFQQHLIVRGNPQKRGTDHIPGARRGRGVHGGGLRHRVRHAYFGVPKIEKNVSIDPTRPCISTYNKHIKIHPRINSTVQVIRACMFIMWSVREVTQRAPPTCTTNTNFTYR